MEIDHILHRHWPWPGLDWDYYPSIFANLLHGKGPCCQNFVSAQYLVIELIDLTKFSICIDVDRTGFGLLCVNFSKFTTQLWPLVIVKISFSLNIFTCKRNYTSCKTCSYCVFYVGLGDRGGAGGWLLSTAYWHFLFVFILKFQQVFFTTSYPKYWDPFILLHTGPKL